MLESLEKLRELAADINASEIVDHMELYPSCVFDGAWLDAWHDEFYRAIDRLESEIAERYMLKSDVEIDKTAVQEYNLAVQVVAEPKIEYTAELRHRCGATTSISVAFRLE